MVGTGSNGYIRSNGSRDDSGRVHGEVRQRDER